MVATISFIYAGALYVLSPSNPAYKNEAKARVKNTAIGVVLVLLTATILYLINPSLLSISSRLELNGPAIQTSPKNNSINSPKSFDQNNTPSIRTVPANPNPNF
jgi:hypothetical protein